MAGKYSGSINDPYNPEVVAYQQHLAQQAAMSGAQGAVQSATAPSPASILGNKLAVGQDVKPAFSSQSFSSKPFVANPFHDPASIQRGVTLMSEISGRVERNRQNQYDYQQQAMLGLMNPMQASDYQPNAYSLYAKYGGSLKTILKDMHKFNNDARMDMDRYQQGGAIQFYPGGVEKTPTGQNNAFDNNLQGVSQEEFMSRAKSLGFRTSDNKALQEDMYNYLSKNNPQALTALQQKYGTPKNGWVDGMLGARSVAMLNSIPQQKQQQTQPAPDPFEGFHGEPVYTPDNHIVGYSRFRSGKDGASISSADQNVDFVYANDFGIQKDKGMYQMSAEDWRKFTNGKNFLLSQDGMDKFRQDIVKKKGGLTPNKAREILHDGTAQGHKLTDKQRRYFGAMSKGNTLKYGK